MQRLLITGQPKHDESFMGYIIRLTELNRCLHPSWILRLAGVCNLLDSNLAFIFNDTLDLSIFKQITGVPESDLAALLYRPTDPDKTNSCDYVVCGSLVPRYVIRSLRPKVCPNCLIDSAYVRKVWDLAVVTACPIHKCLLLDECPRCKNFIPWVRGQVSHCRCELDFRECRTALVNGEELEVTRQIYLLCNLLPEEVQNQTGEAKSNPLLNIDLKSFISALIFIASQYAGMVDTTGKHLIPSRRNAELHTLFARAFRVFKDWPNSFFWFLDWRRQQRVNMKYMRGLSRDFNPYKSALYIQLAPRQFDFLRNAFEEYLLTRWNGGYTESIKRLNDGARQNKKNVSKMEAQRILRIDSDGVEALIKRGSLKAIVRDAGNLRLFLIDRASVEERKKIFDQALVLKQVQQLLGLIDRNVHELIGCGLLNPLRGPTVDGSSYWKFHAREITNLLAEFESKTSGSIFPEPNKIISLGDVITKVKQYGMNLGVLVQAVVGGEITPCGRSEKPGLSGFLFSADQITDYAQSKLRLREGKIFSFREASTFLEVSRVTLSCLIRKGLLRAIIKTDLKMLGKLITEDELKRFSARYFVLTGPIVRELDTTGPYVYKLLAQRKIKPVCGKSDDRGASYVYERSKIKRMNLRELVLNSRSENYKKNTEPGTFELKIVANFIGVSNEVAHHLVKAGFIKPCLGQRHRRKGNNKYYLPYYAIEKCKSLGIEYASLVSTRIASNMLGISYITLWQYVRKGLIKTAWEREGTRPFYFLKEEIKSVVKSKAQLVASGEGAAMLGVSIACLRTMVISGKLKPVSGPEINGANKRLYLRRDIKSLYRRRQLTNSRRRREGH